MKTVSKQNILNKRWKLDYSGVVIIAPKKGDPVFIFKEFMQPFQGFPFNISLKKGFEEGSDNDYCVFWNKKKCDHNLPPNVLSEGQKELMEMLIKQAVPTFIYIDDMLSEDIIELPICYIFDNKMLKIKSPYVSLFKEKLKDMKFIEEMRRRRWENPITIIRHEFVVKEYRGWVKRTKRKRPLPISYIWNKWRNKVDNENLGLKYCSNPNKPINDDELDELNAKCHFDSGTIRRDLNQYFSTRK